VKYHEATARHDDLAPWRGKKNGAEDDGEEQEVAFAQNGKRFFRGLVLPHGFRSPVEVDPVHHMEDGQERGDHDHPRYPEVDRRPEKRNALQIPEEERRITDGSEGAADVADDEDEEDDMERRDAVFVHADPRADHQHGGAGGSDQVR
jgi:hypothetical protein